MLLMSKEKNYSSGSRTHHHFRENKMGGQETEIQLSTLFPLLYSWWIYIYFSPTTSVKFTCSLYSFLFFHVGIFSISFWLNLVFQFLQTNPGAVDINV